MIVLRKKTIVSSLLLLTCICGVFFLKSVEKPSVSAFSAVNAGNTVIVVDAGHGGEDGGAVSPDGVEESQINLAIARQVQDLLLLNGQPVVMTRTEDVSLDNGEATVRKRKSADLRNRAALVNGVEHAALLSIHQNSLPSSPITHGAQVFWNQQVGAQELAQAVQDGLNLCINPGNEKHCKQIPSSVYLMKESKAPAVLVECGFLSNPQETEALQDITYQRKLALTIAAGMLYGIA